MICACATQYPNETPSEIQMRIWSAGYSTASVSRALARAAKRGEFTREPTGRHKGGNTVYRYRPTAAGVRRWAKPSWTQQPLGGFQPRLLEGRNQNSAAAVLGFLMKNPGATGGLIYQHLRQCRSVIYRALQRGVQEGVVREDRDVRPHRYYVVEKP